MNRFLKLFFLFLVLVLSRVVEAQESPVAFLPAGHLFAPLMADPREPNTSLAVSRSFDRYDGALGGTLDFIQWTPSGGSRWACGILGSGYLSIQRFYWASFRLEDIDLWLGTYISESSGLFSNRLEYLHGASHLGDDGFSDNPQGDYSLPPIDYRRDGLQFTDSFQPSDSFRLYGGLGYWLFATPVAPTLFVHLGTEIYSAYSPMDGNRFRGFFAYDLKVGNEELGVKDQNFELGIQWKGFQETGPSFRLAVLYYNGNSLYGQFYGQKDDHWSAAFFVDP